MKAAVVDTFERAPRYDEFEEPVPQRDEVLIEVHAAALSQLVRAQASGKHYSVTAEHLPFVPGVDGVGRDPRGQRVYFAFPRHPVGAMAQRVAVKQAYTCALPDGVDDVTAAAIANPGMSSWAALTDRARIQRGDCVLINGAAGVSGRLAIQIAKHLGAGRVIATARNRDVEPQLRELGADHFVALDASVDVLTRSFRSVLSEQRVDVVLDYLWGPSAEALIAASSTHGAGSAAPRVRFVQIGSLSQAHVTFPAAALRSSGLELMGSGLGSVSNEGLVHAVAGVLHAVSRAGLHIDAQTARLADVESAWMSDAARRLVFTL
jgi:NADPH:quinone reductase-like Zn-dependent oxidoreductase